MQLRKKIALLLFLLGVLPLLGVSYLSYKLSKESLKDEVRSNLEFIATSKVILLQKAFESLEQRAKRTASRAFVVQQAKGLSRYYEKDKARYLVYKNRLNILSQNYVSLKQFVDIAIFTPKLQMVYNVRKNGTTIQTEQIRPLAKELLQTKKTVVSKFFAHNQKTKPYNYILTPIVDENKKIIALLCVQSDIGFLYDILLANAKNAKTLEVILAQKEKGSVRILNPLHFSPLGYYNKTFPLDSDEVAPVIEAYKNKEGFVEHKDYRNKEVLVAYKMVPKLHLALMVKQDVSQAHKKIEQFRHYMYMLFGLALLFVGYIFYTIMGIIKFLERQKQRYETAIDGANEGLWEWDIQNNIITLSKRAKKILHHEDTTFMGYEKALGMIHPKDKERIMEHIKNAISNKAPYKISYRVILPTNEVKWILDRGKILYDEHQKPLKMIGFFTDITKEKNLEEELQNAKDFFELVMDNFPYMVVIKKSDSSVLYANKTAKTFVSQQMVGKNPLENIGEEAGKQVIELAKKALKEGKAEDTLKYTKEGKEYYFHAVSFLIPKNKDEYLVGSTYYDVTEHEKTKIQLKTKDELMIVQSRYAAMGEMIGMIAHQWRQPISAIAMDVNNMLVDIELDDIDMEEFKNNLEGILEQTKHLSNTIDDFRNFFKPDKEKEDVELAKVMEDALKIIGKSLQNNNITVLYENNSTSVFHLYSRELLQVFLNLLSNAKDALLEKDAKEKVITIRIDEEESFAKITICDNGGGIKDGIIHKIFEPYFSTKKQKQGTGLGLYMSKIIVNKHLYGSIEAYNKQEGACFVVQLFKEQTV